VTSRAGIAWVLSAAALLWMECDNPVGADPKASEIRADFFVAIDGNDRWSGTLPSPNAAKTDGPFATIVRARDAVRKLKAEDRTRPVTVMVRGGTYYLIEPILFEPEDSGTDKSPIRYTAYPGEKPVLSGGRPLTGWKTKDGNLFTAHVPGVKEGKLHFRQLRVGERRYIRARYPNYDPKDPIKGGWLFARRPPDGRKGFGTSVACIHNAGDYMEYDITVPAEGEYDYWVYAAMANKPHTGPDISGRTAISIDGGEPVPLVNMADTGGWRKFEWRRAARVHLNAGRRKLRWMNLKGGGINFDAFALTDDADWKPQGCKPPPPAAGRHLLVVQAENYADAHGAELKIESGKFESKTELYCDPGSLKPWPKSPEPEVHIFPRWGWVNGIVRVAAVEPERAMLRLTENWPELVWAGNRFFVENVFEELDAPGEWYLDKAAGIVYVRPADESFTRSEVVGAVLDRLIEFRGELERKRFVSHITISGFTFSDTDYSSEQRSWYFPNDAAVWLRGATHCRIAGCTFRNIGGYAVAVKAGSSDNEITGNEVTGAGEGGVFIDGGLPDEPQRIGPDDLRPQRTLVSGNHIHHCGLIYKHVAGVCINWADHNTVSHNLIHDMPRYGISIKHNCVGNIIEFNEVRRTNLETNDTGGIEVYDNHKPTIIRNNIVADTVGLKTMPDGTIRTPFFAWGIYLDYASRATVTGNIVHGNYRGGIMVGAGSDNLIENNIFTGSKTWQVEFYNSRAEGKGNKFRHNIICYAGPEATALNILKWKRGFVESDRNLFRHVGGPVEVTASGSERRTWKDWQALGMDADSIVADPMFVNAAKDDYRLRPGSPAFNIGFKLIDVTRIGLRGAACAYDSGQVSQVCRIKRCGPKRLGSDRRL